MPASKDESVKRVAALMREIDFCMMTTQSSDGELRSRPMSNNGEVEFDGDVWFFSDANSRKVGDISSNPDVDLSYTDLERFTFLSLAGTASIVRDVKKKQELWLDELEEWFDGGPESEDVVLIKVTASTAAYWSGEDQGEIALA